MDRGRKCKKGAIYAYADLFYMSSWVHKLILDGLLQIKCYLELVPTLHVCMRVRPWRGHGMDPDTPGAILDGFLS